MPFAPTVILKSAVRPINHTEWKIMNIQGRLHRYPQAKQGRRIVSLLLLGLMLLTMEISVSAQTTEQSNPTRVTYNTVKVDGVDVFYREAGPKDAPVVVLLHDRTRPRHQL